MCKVFDGFILELTFCQQANGLWINVECVIKETIKPFN